ncbi:hypothetical protein ACFXQA_07180 [Microbacterium sp. P07]|uniref:hypothetical protein n=1 Tax=Microbacterium sp. P07 TaxID=3366952 RepID=UPI0037455FB5
MSTLVAASENRRRLSALLDGSGVPAAVHYVSLVVAFIVIAFLARNQWFFFDEWSFLSDANGELWSGHAGHWSTVAVLVWMLIRSVFGIGSYFPFVLLAVATHVVVMHLLWRLMRRIGVDPWVATSVAGLGLLLGAASENLLWAFQYGYMGAVGFALGAVLLARRGPLSLPRAVGIAVLLTIGAATSGTALPFFLTVAVVLWRLHGFPKAAMVMAGPVAVYLGWYLLIAGENPNDYLRATGVDILLTPEFMGAMFVESLGRIIPLPYAGIAVVAVLAVFIAVSLRKRLTDEMLIGVAMAGAGIVFAALTAYSRWGTTVATADSGRYVYMVFVTLAPIIAVGLTRISTSIPSRAFIVSILVVLAVYNTGQLVTAAREEAGRESFVRQAMSAGVDLARMNPDAVDLAATPDSLYFPFSLRLAVDLADDGLDLGEYSHRAWLTALAGVGLTVDDDAAPLPNCVAASPGTLVPADAVITTNSDTTVGMAAIADGEYGQPRDLRLTPGTHSVATFDRTPIVITSTSSPAQVCSDGEE